MADIGWESVGLAGGLVLVAMLGNSYSNSFQNITWSGPQGVSGPQVDVAPNGSLRAGSWGSALSTPFAGAFGGEAQGVYVTPEPRPLHLIEPSAHPLAYQPQRPRFNPNEAWAWVAPAARPVRVPAAVPGW